MPYDIYTKANLVLDQHRAALARGDLDQETVEALDISDPGWSKVEARIEVETRRARIVLEMIPDTVSVYMEALGKVHFTHHGPTIRETVFVRGPEERMRSQVTKALDRIEERLKRVGHEEEDAEAERQRQPRILSEMVPAHVEVGRGLDDKVVFRSKEYPGVTSWSWVDGAEDRQRQLVDAALARLEAKIRE